MVGSTPSTPLVHDLPQLIPLLDSATKRPSDLGEGVQSREIEIWKATYLDKTQDIEIIMTQTGSEQ
jgi:hypothetical protein